MKASSKTREDKEFFFSLLKETKAAFDRSKIKKVQEEQGHQWHYSVCATPVKRGEGIIFGLNWGGKGIFTPQSKYPLEEDTARRWNFLKRSQSYFDDYLNVSNVSDVNYANLCFFRSPQISDLKEDDWKLSIPLFEKYVSYISPSWTVMLGSSGVWYLEKYGALKNKETVIKKSGNKNAYSYKGLLFEKFPFYCVVHPQARVSNEVRNGLWKEVMKGMNF